MRKLILVCVIAAFGCGEQDSTVESCDADYVEGYDQGFLDGVDSVEVVECPAPVAENEGYDDGTCDAKPVRDNECFRYQYINTPDGLRWWKVRYDCPE
jgi:hypothetical protein